MQKHSNGLYNLILILYMLGAVLFLGMGLMIDRYDLEYWFIYASYLLCGAEFLYFTFYRGAYLYEPIVLVGMLVFLTYSVAPLLCIYLGEEDCLGFDVMDGCIYATILYMFSFSALLLGYYSPPKACCQTQKWGSDPADSYRYGHHGQRIILISYFWWLTGFGFFTLYFKNAGYSLQYVLSFGLTGEADVETAVSGTLDFLYNFRFCMIVPVFYLWRYGRQRWLYAGMYLVSFMMFMSYGYRNILLEMMVAPLVFGSILRLKPPRLSVIVKLLAALIVMIIFVELFRASIRQGFGLRGADTDGFGLGNIYGALQGNFDLYKTLYGAVTYFPAQHMYTFGQQLIWMTVTFLIPRAFWPGKPTSVIGSLMGEFLGSGAVAGHMAMGTLCEYYCEFGFAGCILCCFCLGRGISAARSWYEGIARSEDSMIAYAVLYPMFMLLAVRGYMPLNFEHILFLEIPVISVAAVKRVRVSGDHEQSL